MSSEQDTQEVLLMHLSIQLKSKNSKYTKNGSEHQNFHEVSSCLGIFRKRTILIFCALHIMCQTIIHIGSSYASLLFNNNHARASKFSIRIAAIYPAKNTFFRQRSFTREKRGRSGLKNTRKIAIGF